MVFLPASGGEFFLFQFLEHKVAQRFRQRFFEVNGSSGR
jgi:hypothetical protein